MAVLGRILGIAAAAGCAIALVAAVLPIETFREKPHASACEIFTPDGYEYRPVLSCFNHVDGSKHMLYHPVQVLVDELAFSTKPYPTQLIQRISRDLGAHHQIGDTLVWWEGARLDGVPQTFKLSFTIWGKADDSLDHVIFVSALDDRGNNLLDTNLESRRVFHDYLQKLVAEVMGPMENCHAVFRLVIYDVPTNTLLEGAKVYFHDERGNIVDSAVSSGEGEWNVEKELFAGVGRLVVNLPGYRQSAEFAWDGQYNLYVNESPILMYYGMEPVSTSAPETMPDSVARKEEPSLE